MVGLQGGAGTLVIKGKFDTVEIDNGFRRISHDFKGTQGEAKSFTSDLNRMKSAAGTLAKGIIGVGAVGATMLTALASQAPAVAPAMARISVATGKLARGLAETLKPAFDGAASAFERLVGFEGEHPKLFGGIVGTLAGLAALKFTGTLGLLASLGSVVIAPATLTAIAALATIGGGAVAVKAVVDKLGAETLPGEAYGITSPELTAQFANMDASTYLQMASYYGRDPWSIGGLGGAERTPEVNAQGQLVDPNQMDTRRADLLNLVDIIWS